MKGMRTGRLLVRWSLVLALAVPVALRGQEISDQEAEVQAVAVIEQLFDAMRASDSASVRGLFADGVTQFGSSFTSREGEPAIEITSLEEFIEIVGGAEVGTLDEQIFVRNVIVDDNLVTVVTPYTFHFDGNFSHCGVDVFLVAQTGNEWKIVGLADTRRRAGCEGWLDE